MAARATRSLLGLTLDPRVVGALHYVLTRGPERVRGPLLAVLSSRLSPTAVANLIKTLKWLLIIGVGRKINAQLNQLALNNWSWKSQRDRWTWDWEVAVVTGGCSGIGKEIVKGLAAKGVKVAVFDIQSLPADLEGREYLRRRLLVTSETGVFADDAGQSRRFHI
jgi:all-trans-retinol dehydrogenase (NAD+)